MSDIRNEWQKKLEAIGTAALEQAEKNSPRAAGGDPLERFGLVLDLLQRVRSTPASAG